MQGSLQGRHQGLNSVDQDSTRVLTADKHVVSESPSLVPKHDNPVRLYRVMVLARPFDNKVIAQQTA